MTKDFLDEIVYRLSIEIYRVQCLDITDERQDYIDFMQGFINESDGIMEYYNPNTIIVEKMRYCNKLKKLAQC